MIIKPQTIKYLPNADGIPDPSVGIDIDWRMIERAYDRLKIPDRFHRPKMDGIEHLGYIIDMSDRSRGKTTNKLILGLLLYWAYGIQLHYIVHSKNQCEPREIRDLYRTVISNGYIEQITGGKYNNIAYRGRRWNLLMLDDDGHVLEQDPDACCVCFGLDDAPKRKSIYNAPLGDMIFFDEFITTETNWDDYKNFSDLCKTIIRDRKSPIIYMSANTIDKNTHWFDDLCIRDQVEKMNPGDHIETITDLGTHIYIEILSHETSMQRQDVNRRFFGFRTAQLGAITGKGDWTTDDYPHIPSQKDDAVRVLHNAVFVQRGSKLAKLQLVQSRIRGICVHVMPATRTYDDSIIFTADDLADDRYVFGFGKQTTVGAYWDLYMQGRFWYSDNAVGAFIKSYVSFVNSRISAMRR